MGKHILIGTFLLISMFLMLGSLAAAESTPLTETKIDYTGYREIEVGKGAVYQIEITNTGTHEKEYEIMPKAEAIREIGSYSIDPSDKIILKAGKKEAIYIYISVEKQITGRAVIPVEIKTGFSSTNIELVARSIAPAQPKDEVSPPFAAAFKIAVIMALVIIILIAIILSIIKMRKKEEEELEKDFNQEVEENVETYY
ncbi:hypothetical protein JXB28_03525 [Candidatus Woesearchaeota archaeon]|nr:hypothetical protein [Candidatus Woesearchaeota archaeon]